MTQRWTLVIYSSALEKGKLTQKEWQNVIKAQ